MQPNTIRNVTLFFSLLFLLAAITSCKKEKAALPYAEIEKFTVTDPSGKELKASITGNEIVVYWPPLTNLPEFVTPQIVVSEKARVEPVSGTSIPFKDGVVFRVTAENGTVQQYTLKAGSNQPVPVFEVNSSEFLRIGKNIDLAGEYFIKDTVKTKLFLVDKNGAQTQLPGITFSVFYSARISAPVPFQMDTGYYTVKLVCGVRTVQRGPFHFDRPLLSDVVVTDAGKFRKPGDISSISYSGPSAKYYYNSFTGGMVQMTIHTQLGFEQMSLPVTIPGNGQVNFTIPHKPGKIVTMFFSDAQGNSLYYWEPLEGSEIVIESAPL